MAAPEGATITQSAHGVFQTLAGLEANRGRFRNRHLFARTRIAASAGLTDGRGESAEADKPDFFFLLQGIGNGAEHSVNHFTRLGAREVSSVSDGVSRRAAGHYWRGFRRVNASAAESWGKPSLKAGFDDIRVGALPASIGKWQKRCCNG